MKPFVLVLPERVYSREPGAVPRFYGRAYWLPDRIAWVLMPVPFNWIAAGARRFWHGLLRGPTPTERERELLTAYQNGYHDGSRNDVPGFRVTVTRQPAKK